MSTDRFTGTDGHERLIDVFLAQPMTGGDPSLSRRLADVSTVEVYPANTEIIVQGDSDTDMYFLLLGRVSIERHGRAGRVRLAGSHIGEMALIDVLQRRSATVRALDEVVVAKVRERDFTAIAAKEPRLWRCLAIEMATRLRQRLEDMPQKNPRPSVFIGSSSEGLPIAESLKGLLEDPDTDVQVWWQGVFEASATSIESLEQMVRESDFAILVLTPDDQVQSRGHRQSAPRDNVIFELGLFMGALGRGRVYVLSERVPKISRLRALFPSGASLKLPSDLLGVTTLPPYFRDATGKPDLTSAVTELKRYIEKRGPK